MIDNMKKNSLLFKIFIRIISFFTPQKSYGDYLGKYVGIKIDDDCEVHRSAHFETKSYLILLAIMQESILPSVL